MSRWIPAAAMAVLVSGVPGAYAQSPDRSARSAFPVGNVEGRVLDDSHGPIAGAMVSVVGRTTAVATTDRNGRYALKELPFGPYILSVHSRGYWKSRGRTIQLTAAKVSVPEIQLARSAPERAAAAPVAATVPVPVTQLAGFGLDMGAPPRLNDGARPLDKNSRRPEHGRGTPASGEERGEGPPRLSNEPRAARGEGAPPASGEERGEGPPRLREEAGEDETAWRLRHLPRSILKEAATNAVWADTPEPETAAWFRRTSSALMPIALFSEIPLSGQVNLLTIESFDRPGELFAANASRNVAYLSVNTRAAGGAWAVQGAMTQGDLSSWIVAGSYKSIQSASHAYELGLSYSTQRYDGGNAAALVAIRDNARNVGSVYGYDEWTISPRLVLGYGSGYARYDYLGGSGFWSPRLSVTVPLNGLRVKALASQRAVVPGAEEFAPSVTGLWLPPERTFSSISSDGRFTAERTRHMQISIERDLAAGVTVSLRGFGQRMDDQLVEMFNVGLPGRAERSLGHYFVGTAGDVDARGWGVRMSQEVPGYVRGAIEYTVATAYWAPSADGALVRTVRAARLTSSENVYDLQTFVEATIPQTATRVYAKYRMNTAFWSGEPDALGRSNANARFNVRVNQSLPFLRFSNADWEMLVDVRNMFREAEAEASIYDEALAIRAPKRIVGGLLVKF